MMNVVYLFNTLFTQNILKQKKWNSIIIYFKIKP